MNLLFNLEAMLICIFMLSRADGVTLAACDTQDVQFNLISYMPQLRGVAGSL
jgi:hypothetical protein